MKYLTSSKLFYFILSLAAMFNCIASDSPDPQSAQCECGQVKLTIDSADPLRFICYCKDCRGYYKTLNERACQCDDGNHKTNSQHDHHGCSGAGRLDEWGGVDYTQVYPSEIKVIQGQDKIVGGIIREKSQIKRFYTTCCHTPLFSVGPSGTALLNSNLLPDEKKAEIKFRIIGRDSLTNKNHIKDRPKMSWSVPMAWFWTMPKRIKPQLSQPMPFDVPDKLPVLEGFKQG